MKHAWIAIAPLPSRSGNTLDFLYEAFFTKSMDCVEVGWLALPVDNVNSQLRKLIVQLIEGIVFPF